MKILKRHPVLLLAILLLIIVNCSFMSSVSEEEFNEQTGNSNANLSSIKVLTEESLISPDFNKNTINYNVNVRSGINTLTISAVPENKDAAIKINNQKVVSGQAKNIDLSGLIEGNSLLISLRVEAPYKKVKTYTLNVTKFTSGAWIKVKFGSNYISNNENNFNAGTVFPDRISSKVFTIENAGISDLVISNISIQGSGFSISQNPAGTVAASSSTTFTVSFNNSQTGSFNASISITCNDPLFVNFSFNILCLSSNTFFEDFESGSFSNFPWLVGGDALPFIQSNNKYSGAFAAQFGNLAYGQKSFFEIEVNCSTDSSISYYYLTSSYYNDYLNVYIDGTRITYYSGTSYSAFRSASYSLSTGEHRIKFEFKKENSSSGGQNTAWLDDIIITNATGEQEISVLYYDNYISNNGTFNAGYTSIGNAKDVSFTVRNFGFNNISLTGSPKVNIISGNSNISVKTDLSKATLLSGESDTFILTCLSSVSSTYYATVSISSNDANENPFIFTISFISAFSEDFESGGLTSNPWYLGGDVLPFVQSSVKYAGGYAVQFGAIADNQKSFFEMEVYCTASSTLSYYCRMNSDYSDNLYVYIDGSYAYSDNGIDNSFSQNTHNFNAGNHKIRFEYIKNSSGSAGADTAWIDNITLTNISGDQEMAVYTNGEVMPMSSTFNAGFLTFGQTRDIIFTIKNFGFSNLNLTGTPKVTLTGSSNITLKNDAQQSSLAKGETDTFILTCNASVSGTYTSTVTIPSNDSNENPYTFTVSFIYGFGEDFESGGLTGNPWYLGGDALPFVQSSEKYADNYAVQFGDIGDFQKSFFEIEVNCSAASVLSFYYKSSSESSDNLYAYIDGSIVFSSSGTSSSFYQNTENMTAGNHRIRFEYQKNYSGSSNSDTAWIDNIILTNVSEVPEIGVYYNNYIISTGNILNIGELPLSKSKDVEFIIKNFGFADLSLLNSPKISITGGGTNFNLKTDASIDILESGVATEFVIACSAVSSGIYSAIISIANNDGNENPFTIMLSFTVTSGLKEDFESGSLSFNPWLTGGNAVPVVQSSTKYAGNYAVQFGYISHNQKSYFEMEINCTAAAAISYYYRTSSEISGDYLYIYVDGIIASYHSGTSTSWFSYSYLLSSGSHKIRFEYNKNASSSSGSDTAWVDDIVITNISDEPEIAVFNNNNAINTGSTFNAYIQYNVENDLTFNIKNFGFNDLTLSGTPKVSITGGSGKFTLKSDASKSVLNAGDTDSFIITCQGITDGTYTAIVSISSNDSNENPYTFTISSNFSDNIIDKFESGNFTYRPWVLGGNVNPLIQTDVEYDGNYAAKFGAISDSESSYFQLSVTFTSASTISFYYSVSSENYYDIFRFYIDDVEQIARAGNYSWTEYTGTIPAGTHILKFQYSKNGGGYSGSDSAWVDNIIITSGGFSIP